MPANSAAGRDGARGPNTGGRGTQGVFHTLRRTMGQSPVLWQQLQISRSRGPWTQSGWAGHMIWARYMVHTFEWVHRYVLPANRFLSRSTPGCRRPPTVSGARWRRRAPGCANRQTKAWVIRPFSPQCFCFRRPPTPRWAACRGSWRACSPGRWHHLGLGALTRWHHLGLGALTYIDKHVLT